MTGQHNSGFAKQISGPVLEANAPGEIRFVPTAERAGEGEP